MLVLEENLMALRIMKITYGRGWPHGTEHCNHSSASERRLSLYPILLNSDSRRFLGGQWSCCQVLLAHSTPQIAHSRADRSVPGARVWQLNLINAICVLPLQGIKNPIVDQRHTFPLLEQERAGANCWIANHPSVLRDISACQEDPK